MRKMALGLFRRLPRRVRRFIIHAATPSYTVGAVAVLRRSDGRIALVEQRHSPGWALPGGLLSRRESASAALVREIVEELGILFDPAALPVPHASVNPDVYGDLVFFETPRGGAVFSFGSMAWCGGLSHNDYDNNVSRITQNVIARFMDAEPFAAATRG